MWNDIEKVQKHVRKYGWRVRIANLIDAETNRRRFKMNAMSND